MFDNEHTRFACASSLASTQQEHGSRSSSGTPDQMWL